jgi:hypothetical protein
LAAGEGCTAVLRDQKGEKGREGEKGEKKFL